MILTTLNAVTKSQNKSPRVTLLTGSTISSFEEHQAYNAKVRETLQWLLLPLRGPADPRGPGLDLEKVAAPAVPVEWLPKRCQNEGEAVTQPSGSNIHSSGNERQPKVAGEKKRKLDKNAGHFVSIREWFGLQSAARWWSSGVQYKQLDHKIHPHPGCYFAVPTSRWVCFHFEVFEKWLATTAGLDGVHRAVEVGVGCGVLSFMMLKHAHGPLHITAADVNPAAVMTVNDNAARLGLSSSLGACSDGAEDQQEAGVCAELSNLVPARFREELDLVVFNPPWFPVQTEGKIADGEHSGGGGGAAGRLAAAAAAAAAAVTKEGSGGIDAGELLNLRSSPSSNGEWLDEASPYLRSVLDGEHWLEAASYRDDRLMEQFFDSSHRALKVGGRVVVIYCNYAQLVGSEEAPGPVPAELEQSDRFVLKDLLKVPVPLSQKVKQGNEAGWKTELMKKLEIEVWVLAKR